MRFSTRTKPPGSKDLRSTSSGSIFSLTAGSSKSQHVLRYSAELMDGWMSGDPSRIRPVSLREFSTISHDSHESNGFSPLPSPLSRPLLTLGTSVRLNSAHFFPQNIANPLAKNGLSRILLRCPAFSPPPLKSTPKARRHGPDLSSLPEMVAHLHT